MIIQLKSGNVYDPNNKIFNTKTCKFEEHRRDNYITLTLDYDFRTIMSDEEEYINAKNYQNLVWPKFAQNFSPISRFQTSLQYREKLWLYNFVLRFKTFRYIVLLAFLQCFTAKK